MHSKHIAAAGVSGVLSLTVLLAGCGSSTKPAAQNESASTRQSSKARQFSAASLPRTTVLTDSGSGSRSAACQSLDQALRIAVRKYASDQEQTWGQYEPDVLLDTAAAADTTAPSEAAPASSDKADDPDASSETNVQEKGIDEGDTAEHDGRYLFTVVRGELRIIDTTTGTVTAHITQASGSEQMILSGDRLLVASEIADVGGRSGGPGVGVTMYDVSDKTAPKVVSQQSFSGTYVALRSTGETARLVLKSQLIPPGLVFPDGSGDTEFRKAHDKNDQIIAALTAESIIPGLNLETSARLRCEDVVVPSKMSFDGMTSVVDIDLADGASHNVVLVANPMGTYQSQNHLYTWSDVWTGNQYETTLHVFDTRNTRTSFAQSIEVHGHLLNQFAVSEYEGALRVATTIRGENTSAIITYQTSDGAFREVSKLTGLGHDHEMIYAVRFAGPTAYVVTFVNTDPLYVVDLADPKNPKLNGELQIPGYSNYLQVVSKDRVIGVGQNLDSDALYNGQRSGAGQVSLFDVSDPQHPKRLDTMAIGDGSESESDHHAFLWWAKSQTLVIPFVPAAVQRGNNAVMPRHPVMVIAVEGDKLVRRGRVTHQDSLGGKNRVSDQAGAQAIETQFNVRRSMVINNQLVTVSSVAVKSTDLVSLYPNWYLTE
jgi:uncharacterized secreted protein with C-terminal beta-propeller domain